MSTVMGELLCNGKKIKSRREERRVFCRNSAFLMLQYSWITSDIEFRRDLFALSVKASCYSAKTLPWLFRAARGSGSSPKRKWWRGKRIRTTTTTAKVRQTRSAALRKGFLWLNVSPSTLLVSEPHSNVRHQSSHKLSINDEGDVERKLQCFSLTAAQPPAHAPPTPVLNEANRLEHRPTSRPSPPHSLLQLLSAAAASHSTMNVTHQLFKGAKRKGKKKINKDARLPRLFRRERENCKWKGDCGGRAIKNISFKRFKGEKKERRKNCNPSQARRLSSSFFPVPLENWMIALRAALCPHIKHSFRDISEHQLVRRPLRAGGGSSLSRPGASRHRHTHFELRRRLHPAPSTQPLPRPNPPPAKLSCGIHSPTRWAASLPSRFHSCISSWTICRSVPLSVWILSINLQQLPVSP